MKSAKDYDQEVLNLFDQYVHSDINRRQFMEKVSKFAVGGLTAAAIFESLAPDYVHAIQVEEDDSRLVNETIEFNSPQGGGTINGLLSRPANISGKLPAVLVVHENRGLNPYIADVTRRAALAGYLALGPDALSPLGGYPGTDDEGRTMQATRDRNEILEDFIAAADVLKNHELSTGKVGVVGFCFGGWVSNSLPTRVPDLAAAVPFYGTGPNDLADVSKINTPMLIHYASLDERVNAGWADLEAAFKANDVDYTFHMYEGANHGFHNDTTPRYDEAAAKLAWQRTLDFFDTHLK